MAKIDLVTGFLGSGKTTFIKGYVKHLLDANERVCILENDFGAVNVDTMLLTDLMCDKLDIESVAGGCDQDCHKRRFKTKLIAMGMKGYDRVIVEPSGIFDIDEFFDSLYDEPLDTWYEIGNVITVIDAGMEFPVNDSVVGCLTQELANSGIYIMNNKHILNQTHIAELKAYLIKMLENKNVRFKKSYDDMFFECDVTELLAEDYEKIKTAGYIRNDYIKYNIEETDYSSLYYMNLPYDSKEWGRRILSLFDGPDNLLGKIERVKGFAQDGDGFYEINATRSEISVSPVKNGQSVIIVIGERLNEEEINKIIY